VEELNIYIDLSLEQQAIKFPSELKATNKIGLLWIKI
jgi:hypothetical protein